MLTTTISLVFVELLREYGHTGKIILKPFWISLTISIGIIWIVMKYLKKMDRLLLEDK